MANTGPRPYAAFDVLDTLAHLFKRHGVAIGYTRDDDGVHIRMDGQTIFVGHLTDDDATAQLESAAAEFRRRDEEAYRQWEAQFANPAPPESR